MSRKYRAEEVDRVVRAAVSIGRAQCTCNPSHPPIVVIHEDVVDEIKRIHGIPDQAHYYGIDEAVTIKSDRIVCAVYVQCAEETITRKL